MTEEELKARIKLLDDPIPLYAVTEPGAEGGRLLEVTKVVAWACAACRSIVGSREQAVACYTCRPTTCEKCGVLGEPQSGRLCRPCHRARADAREEEALEKAEQIPEHLYSGPVWWDGDYYASAETLVDHFDSLEQPCPPRVWASTRHVLRLDADQLLEGLVHDLGPFDGDWDGPEPVAADELRAAIEAWNAKQTGEWWTEDNKRAVVLSPREPGPEEDEAC